MIARYYQELLSHFTRMVRDRDSAADIVQEAYARVLAQPGEVAQPRALLYHTARNLVIDRHRRSVARGEAAKEGTDAGDILANLAGPRAYEPETALASAQAVDAMLKAIGNLPARCREAFILHRFDGLPHAEVAERMGISRKAVEQHIALAMGACRRCKAELDAPGGLAQAASVPRTRRRLLAGASLGLLLSGGLAGALWRLPVARSSHVAAHGERIDTMLADGTRLQLLPGSRATVSLYRARREIELPRGHARFEVARDAGRPFAVLAGALRITVTGTRFSVHHMGDGAVRVAVEEGRVRVARVALGGWFTSGDAVDLVAGQAVGSDAGGVLGSVSAVRAADLSPWHVRRMSFDNATLGQVLGAFERYGDTGLRVSDPAVAALRVTGTFNLLRPDRFAQLLPAALPVRLAHAGGHTEIHAR